MSRKKKEVDVKQDKTIKDLRDVVDFTNETNKEQDKALKNIEESVNMSFKNDAEAHSLNQEQNVRLNEINAKIAKFESNLKEVKNTVKFAVSLAVLACVIGIISLFV